MLNLNKKDILLIKILLKIEHSRLEIYLLQNRHKPKECEDMKSTLESMEHISNLLAKLE